MEFNRKIIGYLKQWKEKKNRKPLIVRGARQVGKTSAILLFAKKHFDYIVNINLEKTEHKRLFSRESTREEFEKIITTYFNIPLVDGKTILFIDEIQELPYIIRLLRFFWEERPGLHIIAAGSLFEVKLIQQNIPLPVGRIEFAYLNPLNFFEYLEAMGEMNLLKYLNNFNSKEKIPGGIHDKLINLFHEYVLVGGMPEAVKVYAATKNIQEVNNIYSNLFTSFKDDIYKYSSRASSKYLDFILEQSPLSAGLSITYEKFAGSVYKSRELHNAFDTLSQAMLLYQVRATKSHGLPLIPNQKKPPKLLFLDIGLVNFQMGIQTELLQLKELTSFYQGRIAEQVVGQNLLSSFVSSPPNLFYWYKGKGSEAEVDFSLVYKSKIIGIEVKSGKSGRLRSIYEFEKQIRSSKLLRIYSGEFKINKSLISLPFYLMPRWEDFV